MEKYKHKKKHKLICDNFNFTIKTYIHSKLQIAFFLGISFFTKKRLFSAYSVYYIIYFFR